MSRTINEDRRRFLRALQCTLAAGTIGSVIPQMDLVGRALAQSAPAGEYKALVCIFLLGGNDSFNMLMPYDQAEYDVYRASRGGVHGPNNRHGMAIARDAMLRVVDRNGKAWGLHPACGEMKALFDTGELAFLANVGTLRQPLSKAELARNRRLLPSNLYSHNDQQQMWMRGHSVNARLSYGWGGLCADRLRGANSRGLHQLPPTISLSGSNLFQAGGVTHPFGMSGRGVVAPEHFSTKNEFDMIRREALLALMQKKYTPIMQDQYAVMGESALFLSDHLSKALDPENGGDIATSFPEDNDLARRLRMVARAIKVSRGSAINHKRQIYYVALGGFDTHNNQPGPDGQHIRLMERLSAALGAFRKALAEIGALNDVVTFTMSEFGRTLNGNGSGTDHGWGGVQLMMGGSSDRGGPLKGKAVHGRYPLLELDGAQTVERGRIIPTTSTNQMGVTLAKWLGVSDTDLKTIFPGLGNFDRPVLDFLA